MKKNILSIIFLFAISSNLYIPLLAFNLNADFKDKASHLDLSTGIIEKLMMPGNDTSKISIVSRGNLSPEKSFNYSNTSLSQNVSFDLKTISKRKFSVSFLNKNQAQVAVKIYDVIGNLIIEENVIGKGYFYKEYDLSFYKSDLFIIEVGNSKYNKTKSLVAG
ncbi:MAG: hypothetical protein M3512_01645 [Bacteroidota bacterium]|nr:hypothetical protein [Bacteroidota bacterium]